MNFFTQIRAPGISCRKSRLSLQQTSGTKQPTTTMRSKGNWEDKQLRMIIFPSSMTLPFPKAQQPLKKLKKMSSSSSTKSMIQMGRQIPPSLTSSSKKWGPKAREREICICTTQKRTRKSMFQTLTAVEVGLMYRLNLVSSLLGSVVSSSISRFSSCITFLLVDCSRLSRVGIWLDLFFFRSVI